MTEPNINYVNKQYGKYTALDWGIFTEPKFREKLKDKIIISSNYILCMGDFVFRDVYFGLIDTFHYIRIMECDDVFFKNKITEVKKRFLANIFNIDTMEDNPSQDYLENYYFKNDYLIKNYLHLVEYNGVKQECDLKPLIIGKSNSEASKAKIFTIISLTFNCDKEKFEAIKQELTINNKK